MGGQTIGKLVQKVLSALVKHGENMSVEFFIHNNLARLRPRICDAAVVKLIHR